MTPFWWNDLTPDYSSSLDIWTYRVGVIVALLAFAVAVACVLGLIVVAVLS